MASWYCKIANQEIGPIASDELKKLAVNGRLLPHDFVRHADMQQWTTAYNVPGLFAAIPARAAASQHSAPPRSEGVRSASSQVRQPRASAPKENTDSGMARLIRILAILLTIGAATGGIGLLGYLGLYAMRAPTDETLAATPPAPPPIDTSPNAVAAQSSDKTEFANPPQVATAPQNRIDALTPKDTAIAFAKALVAGDTATARSLSIGTDTEFELCKAFIKFDNAFVRLANASRDKKLDVKLDIETLVDRFATCDEKIDGIHATLIIDVNHAFPIPPTLKKVGSEWKLELIFVDGTTPAAVLARTAIVDGAAKKIEAGKYASGEDCVADFLPKLKRVDDEISRTERFNAVVGNDPQAWAAQYTNSQYISDGDFLKEVHAARLEINPNAEMVGQVSEQSISNIAARIAGKYGIKIDSQSPVALVVAPRLQYAIIKHAVYGDESESEDRVYSLLVDAGFSLKTLCYRNEQFVPLTVFPVRNWTFLTNCGRSDGKVIAEKFNEQLDRLFRMFSENFAGPSAKHEQDWKRSLWSPDMNSAMLAAYRAAAEAPPERAERTFKGVIAIQTPTVTLLSQAPELVDAGKIQRQWQLSLQRSGFQTADFSPILISHEATSLEECSNAVSAMFGALTDREMFYKADANSIRVYENDVVFELNGQLRRRSVVIWTGQDTAMSLLKDARGVMENLVNRNVDAFTKEAAYRQ